MKRLSQILGVTLLEIMLVLAIASMIIVMSVRYYQSATSAEQSTSVLAQIQAITAAADQLAQGPTGYANVSTANLASIMGGTTNLNTVWGGAVTVSSSAQTTYSISVSNMPYQVCGILKAQLSSNVRFTGLITCPTSGTTAFTYTYNSAL